MRLIDADKLIEKLRDFKEWENDDGRPIHTMSEIQRIDRCINFAQTEPIAFDVDKVVDELEKTMQDLSVIEVFSHIDFDSTIQSSLDEFLKAYNSELLRIIKQGSVSDDVCEWTKSKDYPFDWFVGCDGCEVNHKQGDYCPRCGKKIKVVE